MNVHLLSVEMKLVYVINVLLAVFLVFLQLYAWNAMIHFSCKEENAWLAMKTVCDVRVGRLVSYVQRGIY